MKTPMQEHIEWLKEEIEAYALLLDVKKVEALTLAKEHAEQMREKEKEVIMHALNDGKAMAVGNKENQSLEYYYNETFKNKEK